VPVPVTLARGPRRCPFCGSSEVLRSKRRTVIEFLILPLVLLRPFRCQKCSARHIGFLFRKRDTTPLGAVTVPGRKAS
jgi:DNA-directed RNA polymerase subunit RPC12/RpoP